MSAWVTREEYPYEWIETRFHHTIYDDACAVLDKFRRKPEAAVSTFIRFIAAYKEEFTALSETLPQNTAATETDMIRAIAQLLFLYPQPVNAAASDLHDEILERGDPLEPIQK